MAFVTVRLKEFGHWGPTGPYGLREMGPPESERKQKHKKRMVIRKSSTRGRPDAVAGISQGGSSDGLISTVPDSLVRGRFLRASQGWRWLWRAERRHHGARDEKPSHQIRS
jgi:hypothetical protein